MVLTVMEGVNVCGQNHDPTSKAVQKVQLIG